MARGEIIRKLFKSFSQDNREEFHAVAKQLIQEEKDKNHILLAQDLERILQSTYSRKLVSNTSPWNIYPEVPKDKDTGLPLINISRYELGWENIVLFPENQEILERIIQENRKREIIYSHGLKPSSKLLFCGPPGCGKTLTAKVLSSILNLPLVYVNLPAVFSSYLGETAVNLKKIFDYVNNGEWIVLLDEFDAIAKDRNSQNEHGEIQRLVNSLLQLIDRSNEQSIFIAATNHQSLLDPAIWRRFDEVLFFNKPNSELRYLLLKKNLSSIQYQDIDLEKFAANLKGCTGADIERICANAIKSVILRSERHLTEKDMEIAVSHYLERKRIVEKSIKFMELDMEGENE
ncbi:MAG: AAA family ATPase [Microcoleaceae cyanobacterium]